MKLLALAYGAICYAIFLATFLYAIAFTGDLPVPRTVDSGPVSPLWMALAVNLAVLTVFAVQHSLMARHAFKAWWTRFVPAPIERSTYVLFASLSLILIFWQWRPITQTAWDFTATPLQWPLTALFWVGWFTVLISTFLISHFELFGLRQVWLNLQDKTAPEPGFRTPLLYGLVRHPIYLGFIIAFWSAPVMTVGHLIFAAATTGYILIGIQLEERDLVAMFGEQYRAYRRRVGMLAPWPKPQLPAATTPPNDARAGRRRGGSAG